MKKYEYIITSERADRRNDEYRNTLRSDKVYQVGDVITLDGLAWTVDEVVSHDDDIAGDGTPLAEVGKQIAEQAKNRDPEEWRPTYEKSERVMNYWMDVTIFDPNTEEGMSSDIVLKLTCSFHYDPQDYGNGFYVHITMDGGFENLYDLRYDKSFRKEIKEMWLLEWAHNYWSGKNGAYAIKRLAIERIR